MIGSARHSRMDYKRRRTAAMAANDQTLVKAEPSGE